MDCTLTGLLFVLALVNLARAQGDNTVVILTSDADESQDTKLWLIQEHPSGWDDSIDDVVTISWDWTSSTFRPGQVLGDFNLPNVYFIHDRRSGRIFRSTYDPSERRFFPKAVSSGASTALDFMALDWVGQNIYYTQRDMIGLWSYKTEHFTVILDNLTSPNGIDVDPINGFLFWSEPSAGKISRASLSGSGVSTVLQGLTSPRAITLDIANRRIFWISRGTSDSIYSADYDGANDALFVDNRVELTVLEVHENLLFAQTRFSNETVHYLLNGTYDSSLFAGRDTSEQFGFFIASEDTQPPVVRHPCSVNNSRCEHICVPERMQAVCLCQVGYWLDFDQESCRSSYETEEILFAVDEDEKRLYQVKLSNGDIGAIRTSTPLEDPKGLAYDPEENMVYWIDRAEGIRTVIRRRSLTDDTDETFLDLGATQYQAIAIDAYGRRLLYGHDSIKSVSLSSKQEETLIMLESASIVKDIEVDVPNGHIYFTNAGPGTVERADLTTGGNRQVLVSGILSPYGLALDLPAGKMYWCDFSADRVREASLDGSNERTLATTPTNTCYDVAVDRRYVYITVSSSIAKVWKSLRVNGGYLGDSIYEKLTGYAIYSPSYELANTPKPTTTMFPGNTAPVVNGIPGGVLSALLVAAILTW